MRVILTYIQSIALLSAILLPISQSNAATQTRKWDAGGDGGCGSGWSGSWGCACNWNANNVPASGSENAVFDCSSGAPNGTNHTINISAGPCTASGGASCDPRIINALRVESAAGSNYTFTLQCGHIRTTATSRIRSGTAILNCGANIVSRCAFVIADSASCNATFRVSGATSSFHLDDNSILRVGKCGSGTFILENGASATTNQGIQVGSNTAASSGTILISGCSTLCVGKELSIGTVGTGYISASSSTLNIAGDFDVGRCSDSIGFLTDMHQVNIGEDLIIGHQNGADATFTIDGGTVCIGNGLTISDSCSGGSGSGYLTVTGGANITVAGTASNCCNPQPTQIGDVDNRNRPAELHVDWDGTGSRTELTLNDPAGIRTSTNAIIELDGGLVNGTALLKLEGTNGCGATLRGDGTNGEGEWATPIELRGGNFGCGSAPGETLVISGTITQENASDDIFIKGGTITLGANNIITDAIDIQLDGGILSTGSSTGFSDTANNLTLNNASETIALGSGSHTFTLNDLILGGNTLNITGWTGTAGANGTGGKIYVQDIDGAGIAAATALSGINFSGYTNGYDILSVGGGLYEIVPMGATVPEPST